MSDRPVFELPLPPPPLDASWSLETPAPTQRPVWPFPDLLDRSSLGESDSASPTPPPSPRKTTKRKRSAAQTSDERRRQNAAAARNLRARRKQQRAEMAKRLQHMDNLAADVRRLYSIIGAQGAQIVELKNRIAELSARQ